MRIATPVLKSFKELQILLTGGNKATTFSIVARCPKKMMLGVCVSTAMPAVGDRVPHVEAGVGAIATQAKTNILYGVKGLEMLRTGLSPRSALEAMLRDDPDRESRQVIIVDRTGNTAAFTGKKTIDWKGHLVGDNYAVAGNILASSQVIVAMAQTFEKSDGELAERMLKAIAAGQEAGGDKRGKKSAALLIARQRQTRKPSLLDLRVDEHHDPVKELIKIFEKKAVGTEWK